MAAAELATRPPVVIAGAGPAGLVAAVTLARAGVGSLLVERSPGLSPLPRATHVSTRTMELLRSWGLEDEVRAGQLAVDSTDAWAGDTLAAAEGTVLPLGIADLGQDHDGVTVALRDRATGRERRARAAYVVGADGAHSAVRRLLGIAMTGPDHLDEQLSVLFEAPLAGLVGGRRHGIYFIRHPEAGGVLVPNGAGDRWLYGRGWDPAQERLEDYTDERLAGLVRTAAGVPDLPVRVVAKGAFSFAAQVADRYRRGRAFLVGDAAQRMTPRGGMGLNTAVAEGHDLAWKLAWVLRGWAGPALLDTYEAEWRPLGARRTARSATGHGGPGAAGPAGGPRARPCPRPGPRPPARRRPAGPPRRPGRGPLARRPRRPAGRAGRRPAGLVQRSAGHELSSARTLAAWPSALTSCQARSTRPCSSTRKVERRTPTEVRP